MYIVVVIYPPADIVIWDSHPLALGATPIQVLIDGIPQLPSSIVVEKPHNFQLTPKVPNFGDEAEKAVKYDGLPPLEPNQPDWTEYTCFTNVSSIYSVHDGVMRSTQLQFPGSVVVHGGSVLCSGSCSDFLRTAEEGVVTFVDLEGGSISPGLVSFGSRLGLQTIFEEPSTNDGVVFDPLEKQTVDILGGDTAMIRAVDGLVFGTRDALYVFLVACYERVALINHPVTA